MLDQAQRFMEESGIALRTSARAPLGYYDLNIKGGDFLLQRKSGNGQLITELSINPLAEANESWITSRRGMKAPFMMDTAFSITQRPRHYYASLEMVEDGMLDTTAPTDDTPIAITSISQSTTTLTLVLAEEMPNDVNERFTIYGLADTRFNYVNAVIATLSTDRKTVTATVADEATIPSLTLTPSATGGYVIPNIRINQGHNFAGYKFGGTSAGAVVCHTGGSNSAFRESGTYGGASTVTSNSSSSNINSKGNGQYEIKAYTGFEIEVERNQVRFQDRALDNAGGYTTVRQMFEQGIPEGHVTLYPRLRVTSPKSSSRPVAKIVSAVKSASMTATITTDVPHGLNVGAYISIRGIRDQTNFTSATGQIVASVPTPTTLTVVFGANTTATSYGGSVLVENGGTFATGLSSQAVQSIAIDALGIITVVGNATWTGLTVGEYVNLYGCRNATNGADMGVDGVYELMDLNTTTFKLRAIKDYAGNAVLDGNGNALSPALSVTGTTNCGGMVMMRTTARIHDLKLEQYNYDITKIWGQGENSLDKALPVTIPSTTGTYPIPYTAQSMHSLTTAATTNATSVKTAAASLTAITYTNMSASAHYIKFYNKASAPTVGTDIPVMTIPVPANSFYSQEFGMMGLRFGTGLAYAITGAQADNDTTAITAGSKVVIQYV